MELYNEEIYDRANINVAVIVNDNIRETIIKNLQNDMKNKNVTINSYNYNNINKINNFTNNSFIPEKKCCILQQAWLRKIKIVSSVIIFCVDWQNIINDVDNYIDFRDIDDTHNETNGKNEENKNTLIDSLNGDILDMENLRRNNVNADSVNEDEIKKKKKKLSNYACVQNVEFMNDVNNELIKRIEEINTIIMERKKNCKIILLVILPENTQNTEEYIKYISLLNSRNISAIFITLGLKEIHNKIKKLENLLKDCVNSFFKQYIVSYESKSAKNMQSFFNYNFKKAYILEMLEKYDESMKLYVNLCKVFYENVGEKIFSDKSTFFEYVIFFNYISIRMIFIYLYFKDIKKSVHHIYTHNKIIFLALMSEEENTEHDDNHESSTYNDGNRNGNSSNNSNTNNKLTEVINNFNITSRKDFINYVKYFACEDEKEKNKLNKAKTEGMNEVVHTLYDTIIKEYLYYNLLSCIYFYFYRIIETFNMNTHDIVLYGIYSCLCIYYKIKTLTKRSKLLSEFSNVQFATYFNLAPESYLYDFILNFLIEIFLDTAILKSEIYNLNDFYSALQNFDGNSSYLKMSNGHTYEPMIYLVLNCLGFLLSYDRVRIEVDDRNLKNEKFNIKDYEVLFVKICFEYLNILIKNEKHKEQKEFVIFITRYFKLIYGGNVVIPMEMSLNICYVYAKIYYLVEKNNLKIFLEIKNKSHTNFVFLPFITMLINKEILIFKLNFSNFYEGTIFLNAHALNDKDKEESFFLDHIRKENLLLEEDYSMNDNKLKERRRRRKALFFLNERNMVNLGLFNIVENEIDIEYIELYLYIYKQIIKIKIDKICTCMLRKEYLEGIDDSEVHQSQVMESAVDKYTEEELLTSIKSKVFKNDHISTNLSKLNNDPVINNSEQVSRKNDYNYANGGENITGGFKSTYNYSNEENIEKVKIFEIRNNCDEVDNSYFYKLKKGLYLNQYKNKIICNKNKYIYGRLLMKYVNYFVYPNNYILYLNEYNISYIFITFSKCIKNFELYFSYITDNLNNSTFYLLTKRANVIGVQQINKEQKVKFEGHKNMCKLSQGRTNDKTTHLNVKNYDKEGMIEEVNQNNEVTSVESTSEGFDNSSCSSNDEEDDDRTNDSNKCVNDTANLLINNEEVKELALDETFHKLLSYELSDETNERINNEEMNLFFFEVERKKGKAKEKKGRRGKNERRENKKEREKKKGREKNERREKSVKRLYGRSNFCNECYISYNIKKKKKNCTRSIFSFYTSGKNKLICIPFLVRPTNTKNVNIKFELSFKNIYFQDELNFSVEYSVQPSIITMITRINALWNKNKVEERTQSRHSIESAEKGHNVEKVWNTKYECADESDRKRNANGSNNEHEINQGKLEKYNLEEENHKDIGKDDNRRMRSDLTSYYIYVYNNNKNSIFLKSITNRNLNNTITLSHKSTYCDLVTIHSNRNILIKYKFNYRNFLFPFNKIFKDVIFTNSLKVPYDDLTYFKELNSTMNEQKKSKIRIDLIYSKIVKCNEIFIVESVIRNETNITEEVIIFLYDKKKGRKKKANLNKFYLDQTNSNNKSNNKVLDFKKRTKQEYYNNKSVSQSSSDSSSFSSNDLENLIDQDYYISDDENKNCKKKYIVTGVRIMKNILLPYQTLRLKWSFIAFTYGFVNLPNVLIKRKTKIKNNINVFSSENIELFVI
ncbi:hypothetical protein PMALA_004070 [Plasmodium malariae]|uniref:CCAAT-box DNA binding protein subunit B n=1 Tax=Plasmodium malariae TaxID=5858 RepID=A0A1A8VSI3_PLAMA|nr:hypothetical protein PMALA_004070 [Plasmodium malariae]